MHYHPDQNTIGFCMKNFNSTGDALFHKCSGGKEIQTIPQMELSLQGNVVTWSVPLPDKLFKAETTSDASGLIRYVTIVFENSDNKVWHMCRVDL